MKRAPARPIALSVVVITYNMARELPRTLRSLSPSMQRGIEGEAYEVIVVDNGSHQPLDEAALRRHAANATGLRQPEPTVSPVPAIHTGLAAARGELVGIFIDGARIASPGLLAGAVRASRLHPRPVIGAVAFHLGPGRHSQTTRQGYDQGVEDRLLEDSGWEKDGYKLFEIAAFAGSSKGGWLAMPNETNSLFMPSRLWAELGGGYDRRFVAPGGGLANMDVWKRAVEDEANQPVLLLGEATFHQVHRRYDVVPVADIVARNYGEYAAIRGAAWTPPDREPLQVGILGRASRATLKPRLASQSPP